MTVSPEQLAELLPDYLPRQRWYAGEAVPEKVEIIGFECLREGLPSLLWVLAQVPGDGASYQLLVGIRPLVETEDFLEGKGRTFLGDIETDDGVVLAYDALVDPELAPAVLGVVAPDVEVTTMRPLAVEQSNTSVVFDDSIILKVFRRVHDEPNPDVEVVDALAAVGYEHTPKPVGTWRRDGRDLAVAREFLGGGADGWHLALTSLRDLYDRRCPPEECGGDFAPEAARLGETTGALHVKLAEAFGSSGGQPSAWADALHAGLVDIASSPAGAGDVKGVDERYDALRSVRDPGASIRIHGDLHLGQVLRTDTGWYVLDFEGEPRVPVAERRKPSSPLRDVAGMVRSFHYASAAALLERQEGVDDELRRLADLWVERNRRSYLKGYLRTPGIEALLPAGEAERNVVLDAFELGKAVYEVGYEREHRPDWEHIPRSAIERLLV
jgi:maltokinase